LSGVPLAVRPVEEQPLIGIHRNKRGQEIAYLTETKEDLRNACNRRWMLDVERWMFSLDPLIF
jgi:hypothetical protein